LPSTSVAQKWQRLGIAAGDVAAGYKDATQIKKDNDLDSLRARVDFKKLVAELDRSSEKVKR
jgi:hypothetical protein